MSISFGFTILLFTTFCLLISVNASIVPNNGNNLCSTHACKVAANFMKDAIDTNINPCDDFYKFSCNGWMNGHHIPEWKSKTGVGEELEDKQMHQIKTLLEKFIIETDFKTSSNSVSLTSYIYQKCVQLEHQTESVALQYLKELVETVLGRKWNIGQNISQDNNVESNWYELYVRIFVHSTINPIFQMYIEADSKNVTSKIVLLESAEFNLGNKELADLDIKPELIKAYKNYIRSTAELMCEENCNSTIIDKDVDEIVQLESQLAKVKMPIEDQRDPELLYNKMSLKQLANRTNFDWLDKIFLPSWNGFNVINHSLSNQTEVIVGDLEYYEKAIKIIDNTSPRVIENYFGFLIVTHFGPFSSEAFRKNMFEFKKVHHGITNLEERWRTCLHLVNSNLDWALSRLYVDHHFTKKEKQEATNVINEVQDAFRYLLEHNTWLDETTRNASIGKLNKVTKNVAYPDWLLDNLQLDTYHGLDNRTMVIELLSNKNYLMSYVNFLRLNTEKYVNELEQPIVVDKSWPMPPFIVNAAYEPDQNSITIPACQLKAPFFDAEYPASLNYGNIGATIGHELTHGLDDEGRQYDADGNLKTWWTEESIERFNNRSECYVQQYSNQQDGMTGLHLNGRNTLGENIADNGGLNEAFVAFQTHQRKYGLSPRLSDLPQYTPEQLFFISYGNSWCSRFRTEAMRQQIEYNVHAPAQFRVNVPVSNSNDFMKAFNCPTESPMNSKHKCTLW